MQFGLKLLIAFSSSSIGITHDSDGVLKGRDTDGIMRGRDTDRIMIAPD